MMDSKKSPKPYGPPRWWESATWAPLAYFAVIAAGIGILALVKMVAVALGYSNP